MKSESALWGGELLMMTAVIAVCCRRNFQQNARPWRGFCGTWLDRKVSSVQPRPVHSLVPSGLLCHSQSS